MPTIGWQGQSKEPGYTFALEHAQHADMRLSTRASSTEHQCDSGSLFRKRRKRAKQDKTETKNKNK